VAAGTAVAAAVLIGAVPALILAGTAQGAARHPADSERGRLVSATPLRTLATPAAGRWSPSPTATRATAATRRPGSRPALRLERGGHGRHCPLVPPA
jgi:hypothetical protein